MKLKSGRVFWPQVYPGRQQSFPKLDHDVSCDIAIIGGGISGALAAYHLTREGIHAVMLDRRLIGHGSTSASTGLLQYEIDVSLVDLIKKLGKDRAVAAYQASVESVRAFGPLVSELGDPCGLIPRTSVYLASKDKDVAKLRAESEARRAIQIDVEFLTKNALRKTFNISRSGALWSGLAYEVDPFRLTLQLIRRSVEQGLKVFEEMKIVRFEARDKGMTLHTANGVKIRARKVILATGYETMGMIPPNLCRLSSTYALCSEPVDDLSAWRDQYLIWESARPYLYMRTAESGRVIVGGEDEDIVDSHKRDRLIEQKIRILLGRFSSVFPDIKIEASYAWAGTFAQTKDGLPYIGTLPEYPHCYFALGYGGNGITFSLIAAEIIRDLFLGRENDKINLFRFDR